MLTFILGLKERIEGTLCRRVPGIAFPPISCNIGLPEPTCPLDVSKHVLPPQNSQIIGLEDVQPAACYGTSGRPGLKGSELTLGFPHSYRARACADVATLYLIGESFVYGSLDLAISDASRLPSFVNIARKPSILAQLQSSGFSMYTSSNAR